MEDTEGEVADSSGRVRGEARAGRHSAPDSPHRARARLLIHRGISRRRPRTCLEHRRPPATCTSLLGRALAAWENTSKLAGTRPLSTNNSVPASSTSLIRLRIFRVASIFSQTSLASLSLSFSPSVMEYKISPRTLFFLLFLFIYNRNFIFLRVYQKQSLVSLNSLSLIWINDRHRIDLNDLDKIA